MNSSGFVLISTTKKIYEETRLLIGDSEILGASRYRVNGRFAPDVDVRPQCIEFVNKILRETQWRPDDLFCLDVSLTDDGFKIIEVNSFSCSGWYAMDTKENIELVSRLVQRNYDQRMS